MNKFILSLLLVSFLLQLSYAQRKQAFIKDAEHAFYQEKDYYKAFKYYEAITEPGYYKDTLGVLYFLFQKAESARLLKDYKMLQSAKSTYLEFLQKAEATPDSLKKYPYSCVNTYLGELTARWAYLGDGKPKQENYEEAMEYYNKMTPDPCREVQEEGQKVIEFALESIDDLNYTNASIEVKNIGNSINSPFSDFAPMPWGGRLYFSSNRTKFRQKGIKPEQNYSRIYLSSNGGPAQQLTTITPPTDDEIRHVGHTTFNQDQSRLYFTLCEFVDATLATRCELFYHELDGQGAPIGKAVEVSALNRYFENHTITQPFIAWEAAKEQEVLYFVSDRSENKRTDIWKVELGEDGSPIMPPTSDLGINTPGDEMTPFYQDNRLYFSSNGYPNRYGGFDVFSIWDFENGQPVNLGQKINSSTDELYYTLNKDGSKAYFSSNRPAENTYYEAGEEVNSNELVEACCLDIYSYDLPACVLEVSTYSNCNCPGDNSRQPLEGATVSLYDITNGPINEESRAIKPSSYNGNVFSFNGVLSANRKYLIVGTVPGLGEQRRELDFTDGGTPCMDGPEKQELCFECTQPQLTVEVYQNNEPVRNAKVWILNADKQYGESAELPSVQSGDFQELPCTEIAAIMSERKGIPAFSETPIEFERAYRIIAGSSQNNLPPKEIRYTASRNDEAFCGLTCNHTLRIDLDTPELLSDIQLFFHNDVPRWPAGENWDSDNGALSAESFVTTLENYAGISNQYLERFNNEGDEDQKLELGTFFDNELASSKQKLIDMAKKATELLCLGIPVTIEANGCYSPKFTDTDRQKKYNQQLVKRRENSVKQDLQNLGLTKERWGDLYKYNDQVDKPCIDLRPNIKIPESDLQDQENEKFSVFSINAAVARRVELKLKIEK